MCDSWQAVLQGNNTCTLLALVKVSLLYASRSVVMDHRTPGYCQLTQNSLTKACYLLLNWNLLTMFRKIEGKDFFCPNNNLLKKKGLWWRCPVCVYIVSHWEIAGERERNKHVCVAVRSLTCCYFFSMVIKCSVQTTPWPFRFPAFSHTHIHVSYWAKTPFNH